MSLIIPAFPFFQLPSNSPPLIHRIIQFTEAVGNFHLPGINLPALRPLRLIRLLSLESEKPR
jgi:hypothetical protein